MTTTKPQPADIDRLIEAAQAWREFQKRDSVLDQKSDVRLRGDAEQAREDLLTAIDALENEPLDEEDATPWCHACGAARQRDCHCGPMAEND